MRVHAILPLLGLALLQVTCGSNEECETHTDCPVGKYCSKDRFCVDRTACQSNAECMPGRFCSKDGVCAAQCTDDSECGGCQCDLLFGLCVQDLGSVVGRGPAHCCAQPPAGQPQPGSLDGLCEEVPSSDGGAGDPGQDAGTDLPYDGTVD